MIPAVLPATFTAGQASTAGVHPRDLYRWRDEGRIIQLSRGVFRSTDAPAPSFPDLLAVSVRAPRAVTCTVSAAVVHDLTDALPVEVQVAVPNGTHPPRITWPPTRVLRFDPSTHGLGVTSFDAAPGEAVPVYDAARTVVDLLRLRHRFGHDVAYSALSRYLVTPDARRRDLYAYAKALGAGTVTAQALEVVTAS